ncbi:MAG: solute:sodium symporter family transporter [Eubacteriales bacterium]
MEQLGFTLVTFIGFTVLVAVISARIVRRSDNQKTAKGYFLAGNGLSGIFIAGSMLLTNQSAENLIGLSGASYLSNMSGMAWESTAVIATIIMAFVFLPIYLRKGYTTLPEFLEDRFGIGVRRLASVLFLMGYLVIGIPVTLYAGAIGFNQIFSLSDIFGISTELGITLLIVVVGIIGAIYAVLGGLKAVAVSDSINGILLIVGSILVVVFGLHTLGFEASGGSIIAGLEEILTVDPEKLNAIGSSTDSVPFRTIFGGMLLANMFYWGTNQVLIQRSLGAKNLKEGQKGVLISGFLKMLVPILMVFPGIIAYKLIPGLENSDYAYPALVAMVLPWPVVGLFCAALFGAVISTYNSFLNAASTIFVMDIYKPLAKKPMTDEQTVKFAKKIGWGFAAFAIMVSPMLQVVSDGLYNFGRSFTGFYNIPIITLVLIGMFSKKGSTKGAFIATGFHIFLYSGYKFWFAGLGWSVTDAICSLNYMDIYLISFIIMVIIMVVSTNKKATKTFDKGTVVNSDYDMTPWAHKNLVAVWLISILVYQYFIFSPLGVATTDKNIPLIIGVSIAVVIETIVLYVMGYNKQKKLNLAK